MKIVIFYGHEKIQLKIVIFTGMKNRCMLHGCVFVMAVTFVRNRHGLNFFNCYKYKYTKTENTYQRSDKKLNACPEVIS